MEKGRYRDREGDRGGKTLVIEKNNTTLSKRASYLIKASQASHHLHQNCQNETPAINIFSQITDEGNA